MSSDEALFHQILEQSKRPEFTSLVTVDENERQDIQEFMQELKQREEYYSNCDVEHLGQKLLDRDEMSFLSLQLSATCPHIPRFSTIIQSFDHVMPQPVQANTLTNEFYTQALEDLEQLIKEEFLFTQEANPLESAARLVSDLDSPGTSQAERSDSGPTISESSVEPAALTDRSETTVPDISITEVCLTADKVAEEAPDQTKVNNTNELISTVIGQSSDMALEPENKFDEDLAAETRAPPSPAVVSTFAGVRNTKARSPERELAEDTDPGDLGITNAAKDPSGPACEPQYRKGAGIPEPAQQLLVNEVSHPTPLLSEGMDEPPAGTIADESPVSGVVLAVTDSNPAEPAQIAVEIEISQPAPVHEATPCVANLEVSQEHPEIAESASADAASSENVPPCATVSTPEPPVLSVKRSTSRLNSSLKRHTNHPVETPEGDAKWIRSELRGLSRQETVRVTASGRATPGSVTARLPDRDENAAKSARLQSCPPDWCRAVSERLGSRRPRHGYLRSCSETRRPWNPLIAADTTAEWRRDRLRKATNRKYADGEGSAGAENQFENHLQEVYEKIKSRRLRKLVQDEGEQLSKQVPDREDLRTAGPKSPPRLPNSRGLDTPQIREVSGALVTPPAENLPIPLATPPPTRIQVSPTRGSSAYPVIPSFNGDIASQASTKPPFGPSRRKPKTLLVAASASDTSSPEIKDFRNILKKTGRLERVLNKASAPAAATNVDTPSGPPPKQTAAAAKALAAEPGPKRAQLISDQPVKPSDVRALFEKKARENDSTGAEEKEWWLKQVHRYNKR